MKAVGYILLLLLLVFAQVYILPFFEIDELVPDIIFVGIVFVAIREGGVGAMLLGSGAGLLRDAFSPGLLGSTMLSLVVAAFCTGIFARHRFRMSPYWNAFLIFGITFVYSALYYFLQLFDTHFGILQLLLRFAFPAALYTFLVIGIAYFLLPRRLWGKA